MKSEYAIGRYSLHLVMDGATHTYRTAISISEPQEDFELNSSFNKGYWQFTLFQILNDDRKTWFVHEE